MRGLQSSCLALTRRRRKGDGWVRWTACLGRMDCLPFAHFDFSPVLSEPLLVELSRRFVLSRNKLNGVPRLKHPRQPYGNGLKLLMKHSSVLFRVVANDFVNR